MNNAAVSAYAAVDQLTIDEIERIIQVDLLGQIYGMKAVLPDLRRQGQGTIVNVGSVESVRAVPLQAPYVAAKHGIKGFTEALRLELAHARSKLGVFPRPLPPVYEPRVVAEAIVFAQHPRRTIVVGGAGQALIVANRISPSLADWFMLQKGRFFKEQKTNRPDDGEDNLFAPMGGTGVTTGAFGAEARATSLTTHYLGRYPNRQRAVAGALLLALLTLVRRVGRPAADGRR